MGPQPHFDSGIDMHFSKFIATSALALLLTACSSSPSDGDVVKLVETQMQKGFALSGMDLSDVMAVEVKVINKAKQDDGKWLVQVETTTTAKKDFRDYKQGQVIAPTMTLGLQLVKGDSGWMAAN